MSPAQPSSIPQAARFVKPEPTIFVKQEGLGSYHISNAAQHGIGASSVSGGAVPSGGKVEIPAASTSLSFGFAGGRGKSSVKGGPQGGKMGGMVIRPAANFSSGGGPALQGKAMGGKSGTGAAKGSSVSMFGDSDDEDDEKAQGGGTGVLGMRKGARAVGRKALDDGC